MSASLNFEELSIELTHRCLFNCIFCSSNAGINPEIKEEIDLSRLKEIILECKSNFGVTTISLSGGEPFLYLNLFPIVEFILENKLKLIIYTTGLIWNPVNHIKPWDESLIKYFLDLQKKYDTKITFVFDIQISKKKKYEKITKKSGSFKLLLTTLKKIQNANFVRSAHLVPFKKNIKEIEETIAFCINFGFQSVKILRFVPQGRASKCSPLSLDIDEFYLLQLRLKNLISRYGEKVQLGHPIDFLFLLDSNFAVSPCRAGKNGPIILPNGEVHLCPAWKNIRELKIGNIYQSNFKTIWTSGNASVIRTFLNTDYQKINGLCRDCTHLNECKGKCIAQRILARKTDFSLPNCLMEGPDPMCLELLKCKRSWE